MFTAVVLAAIAFLWWRANKAFMVSGHWKYRRLRASWAWAFIGGAIGSYFGVAGLGGAIIGTVPGALLGYLAASNLMKRDIGEGVGRHDGPVVHDAPPLPRIQPPPAIPAPAPQAAPTKQQSESGIGTVVTVALVVGTWWLYKSDASAPSPQVVPRPSSTEQPARAVQPEPSAYDREFSRLKAAYPKLNPDSSHYDSAFVANVHARMDTYAAQGLPAEAALRRAVADALSPPRPAQARSLQSVTPAQTDRPCEYKGVMTDDDYRACGIPPPGSR